MISRKSNFICRYWLWLIALIALFICCEYIPNLWYLTYKVGIGPKIVLDGLEIKMEDGWAPVTYSRKKITNFKNGNKVGDGVMLYKIDGFKPGIIEKMTIFINPSLALTEIQKKHFEEKQYKWGNAAIVTQKYYQEIFKDKTPSMWIILVKDYGLMIQTSNLDTLQEIKSINVVSTDKR